MPGHNDDKIPHSGCPIGIQHVTGQAFSQCHKGHPFRLSYGCQIPYGEWSRNGSRRPAGSQGVLLDINEIESSCNIHMDELDMRDELNTRPMPSKELGLVQPARKPRLHRIQICQELQRPPYPLLKTKCGSIRLEVRGRHRRN